jgi:hypothetical protein
MEIYPIFLRALKRAPAFALLIACLARADEAQPQPYILYLGADLSVERSGGLYPVQNVRGKSFVIEMNGKEVWVPMGGNTALKESLKLTKASVSIHNLNYKQTYTPGNDPDLDLQGSAMMNQAVLDTGTQAPGNSASGAMLQNGAGLGPNQSMSSQSAASNGVGASAMASLGQKIASGSNGFNSNSSSGPAEGAFDAIDLSFDISADHTLTDPYMIVIVRYHDRSGKPDSEFNWIHAGRLDSITGKVEKIQFTGAGFSSGYQVESVQVHIYDRGEEVATNVSPKRMELTRDQAFMYLTFDYIGSHKGATLPAAPTLETLTKDARSRLPDSLRGQTLYVRVSKDGRAVESFLDSECTRRVEDPGLDSALQEIHFNPALLNGAPVAGVAELTLGQQPM